MEFEKKRDVSAIDLVPNVNKFLSKKQIEELSGLPLTEENIRKVRDLANYISDITKKINEVANDPNVISSGIKLTQATMETAKKLTDASVADKDILESIKKLNQSVKDSSDEITTSVKSVFAELYKKVEEISKDDEELKEEQVKKVTVKVNRLGDILKKGFDKAFEKIKYIFERAIDFVKEKWQLILGGSKVYLDMAFDISKKLLSTTWSITKGVWHGAKYVAQGVRGGIKNFFHSAWSDYSSWQSDKDLTSPEREKIIEARKQTNLLKRIYEYFHGEMVSASLAKGRSYISGVVSGTFASILPSSSKELVESAIGLKLIKDSIGKIPGGKYILIGTILAGVGAFLYKFGDVIIPEEKRKEIYKKVSDFFDYFVSIPERIVNIKDDVFNYFSSGITSVKNSIVESATTLYDGFLESARESTSTIGKGFETLGKFISEDVIEDGEKKFIDPIKNFFKTISDFFLNPLKYLKNIFKVPEAGAAELPGPDGARKSEKTLPDSSKLPVPEGNIANTPVSGRVTDRMKTAMTFFTNKGMSEAGAAGFVGNLAYESIGLNPSAIGDKGTSFGLGQWHNERARAVKSFTASRNKPWNDFQTQLEYAWHELNQPEWAKVKDYLMNAKDYKEASVYVRKNYEKPAERYAYDDRRIGLAGSSLKAYKTKDDTDIGEKTVKEVFKGTGADLSNIATPSPTPSAATTVDMLENQKIKQQRIIKQEGVNKLKELNNRMKEQSDGLKKTSKLQGGYSLAVNNFIGNQGGSENKEYTSIPTTLSEDAAFLITIDNYNRTYGV
jgi:hypothetical protein